MQTTSKFCANFPMKLSVFVMDYGDDLRLLELTTNTNKWWLYERISIINTRKHTFRLLFPLAKHFSWRKFIYLSLSKKNKQIDLTFSQQVSQHKRKKKHKVDLNKLFAIHHTGDDDCECFQ